MRILTFTLGAILAVYCSAGTLSEKWPNNQSVNRALCEFFLCNNAPLVERARDQLTAGTQAKTQQAIDTFRVVLQQDPQDPYRWADLGDGFLQAGQDENARYCFDQVMVLASHSANLLMRVADFYFQIGDTREAMPIAARILALTPDYDSIVFNDYLRNVDRVEDVLRFGLPSSRRTAKSWLQFLIEAGRLDDAQRTWDWVVRQGYDDDESAGEFVGFLVQQGYPDSAASVWAQHTGARPGDYEKSAYVFNGGFESAPVQSPFDWKLARTDGVEVGRDCNTAWEGKCALRIDFAGTQNLGVAVASQLAYVKPGTYRFRAFIRTEGLTTDQGIRFRISDAEAPSRLDEVFGQFTGSTAWSGVDHDFVVTPKTRLLRIEVIRQPSMKFDNKIGGTAWIDQLTLEPTSSRPSQ